MKTNILIFSLAGLGALPAQDSTDKRIKPADDPSLERVEFGRFFGGPTATPGQKQFGEDHPYSKALGFTLWKSPGTKLYEVTQASTMLEEEIKDQVILNLDPDYNTGLEKFNKLGKEEQTKLLNEMNAKRRHLNISYDEKKQLQLNTYTPEEYEKIHLSPNLGIENAAGYDEGSAVLFSIRDSFSYYNLNQEGFSVDYNSTNGKESLKAHGALMLDIYPDFLYNTQWKDPWIIQNKYRFSLRTGVEFDRDDAATKATDRTSLYLLGNFQANPDQNAHLFGNRDFFQITSPQFVQIGGVLDHDSLTGTDDFRFVLSWQPRFYLLKDFKVLERTLLGRTLGINHVMHYEEGDWFNFQFFKPTEDKKGQASAVDENGKAASAWYSYIPTDIKLAGVSDAVKALSKGKTDFSDVNLEWKAGLVFGNSDYNFRFGYLMEGVSSIDLGETHVGHTLFAEYIVGNVSEDLQKAQYAGRESPEATSLSDADFGNATIFAKYRFGEHSPTFQNVDEFQIGTRVRF